MCANLTDTHLLRPISNATKPCNNANVWRILSVHDESTKRDRKTFVTKGEIETTMDHKRTLNFDSYAYFVSFTTTLHSKKVEISSYNATILPRIRTN